MQNGGFIDAPRIVSLGFNENSILITENNDMVWKMGEYAEMDEQINKIGALGTMEKIAVWTTLSIFVCGTDMRIIANCMLLEYCAFAIHS